MRPRRTTTCPNGTVARTPDKPAARPIHHPPKGRFARFRVGIDKRRRSESRGAGVLPQTHIGEACVNA